MLAQIASGEQYIDVKAVRAAMEEDLRGAGRAVVGGSLAGSSASG